jgi:hypothetical protein
MPLSLKTSVIFISIMYTTLFIHKLPYKKKFRHVCPCGPCTFHLDPDALNAGCIECRPGFRNTLPFKLSQMAASLTNTYASTGDLVNGMHECRQCLELLQKKKPAVERKTIPKWKFCIKGHCTTCVALIMTSKSE